jgi:uncharacterized protein YggE
MRTSIALTLAFLVLHGAPPCAAQDGKLAKGTITTSGSATVKVQPDTVHITFGHQIKMMGLKDVRAESDRQVKKITEALQALKIDTLKVTTTNENLQAIYSSNPGVGVPAADVPLALAGYQTKTSFKVTVKAADIGKLREIAKRVVDSALDNGANLGARDTTDSSFLGGGGPGGRTLTRSIIPGIEYSKEDTTEERKQALNAAVKVALANATALANGAKVKTSQITAIVEQGDTPPPPQADPNDLPAILRSQRADNATPRVDHAITVRVRVTVGIE